MIMLVSRDPDICKALAASFFTSGEVVIVNTALEALARASEASVIVLDLLGQGINGHAFTGISVPLVVLSFHGVRPVLIHDQIMRPFTLSRLLEVVITKVAHAAPSQAAKSAHAAPSQDVANVA
jgi:FixJ family two-component response regulator